MSILQRLGAGLKAFTMSWSRQSPWWGGSYRWGRTAINYATEIGDGRGNSIVEATLGWIAKKFPEAPPQVLHRVAKGEYEAVPDHRLTQLLRRPNPFYSGITLWMATLADWKLGNAYWLKGRAVGNNVVELWWVPSTLMTPKWPESEDNRVFISHYEYSPNGKPLRVEVQDVVHFRNGIDPNNVRLGLSTLGSVLREIFTDNEAANYTASLLRNLGVPGALISPSDGDTEIPAEDVPEIKAQWQARFTGDRRGEVMVSGRPVKVETIGFSPEQMNLKDLRRLPEERITAVLGPAAIVAGMGAGLDRSTYANMAEAREASTEDELAPDWVFFAEEIRAQLLPDFDDPAVSDFRFDLSKVRALQEDQNALADRLNKMVLAGRLTVNQSLAMQGLEQLPNGDVLYVPINVTVTPMAELGAPLAPPIPTPEPLKALTVKSASDYVPALQQLRANLQPALQRQVTIYLVDQQRRVLARVRNDFKAAPFIEHKDYGEEVLEWNEEQRALEAIFDTAYRQALSGTTGLVEAALSVSFEIDDPLTRAYLQQAGRQIVGISEVTQRAISHTLQEGQALGEGVDELLQRIQRLTQFSETRAATIARTELGTATNLATVTSFEASGVVVGVRVHDGTDHDGVCADLNGKTFGLAEARGIPALAHPNCVRAFAPLTRAAQLERRSNGNGHVHHAELRELVEVG